MTHAELMQQLVAMWPRVCTSTWARAWGEHYRAALGRHAGPALASAWQTTIAGWTVARPPQPAEIARHLPESATSGQRQSGARGEQALPFGKRHFEVCHAVAAQLLTRWREAHRQWLPADDLVTACAMGEARIRADRRAAELVMRGHTDAPEGAAIDWLPRDWEIVQGRAATRQRWAAQLPAMGPSRLKPLHVVVGDDGIARMARNLPAERDRWSAATPAPPDAPRPSGGQISGVGGAVPAWLDDAPPMDDVPEAEDEVEVEAVA